MDVDKETEERIYHAIHEYCHARDKHIVDNFYGDEVPLDIQELTDIICEAIEEKGA